jgi:histidinol-phosphate aminotransferase
MAAKDIALALREQGIIVRHLTNNPRITNYLRISVGSQDECAQLVTALESILV